MKHFAVLFFSLTLALQQLVAQDAENIKLTLEVDSADIMTLVTKIEEQASVRFYFEPSDFDSLKFTSSANNSSLTAFLNKTFRNSGISYSVYKGRYIILTKGEKIYTSISELVKGAQSSVPVNQSNDSAQLASVENKLYVVGVPGLIEPGKSYTLAGYVRDGKTGEPIVGASVRLRNPVRRVVTDDYGYYAIDVPAGRNEFTIESLGMSDRTIRTMIYADGKLDFELQGRVTTLRNVIISREKLNNLKSAQMGMQRIDIKTVKQVPVVFGEADVLRVITTLPGVKTVGEASTGLNVRGGSSDQNLVLFNDATIYNPAHFFGMFSAFNPDIVKDVVLYKSSAPARFGGRLSSVIDISSKEGNKKEFSGSAGLGPVTSRIMLEGPIVKERTTFVVGGRTTYANWLLGLLPDEYEKSKASFYDINLLLAHNVNKRNDLYLTAYTSSDRFRLKSDTTYRYGNLNFNLKWKHVFNNKLNVVFSGGSDNYKYSVDSRSNPVNAYRLQFGIQQSYFKAHFTRYINSGHTLDFGLSALSYRMNPGTFEPAGDSSLVTTDRLQKEYGMESALYINDSWTLTDNFAVEAGIRLSVFNSLGPREINTYAPSLPKNEESITGTTKYEKGKFIKNYGGPEYRLAVRQSVGSNSSIKLSFNTQRQYIHMISNTAAMVPTDIWKLSDPNIKPQTGTQYSVGYFRNLKNNTIELSAEFYYKDIKNYLDYKSGANLVMNHTLETDVVNTEGRAYGAEFLVKKSSGKLNGWVSYTWSRILLKQDDPYAGELINDGKEYPANYDKPHDVTLVGNYRVNHRFSVSLNTTYSTGRPITLPVGRFYYANSYRTLFGPRNGHRIPDYFRADFSMNIEGNHKVKQKTHNSWTIGVYNFTGRKNPFSVYYVSENGVINGYKLSIFGSAIPFISFNIRF